MADEVFDVIVIGGGQSGLAVGYYLRRTGLNYLILDANELPGGSWQHYWKSLRLFSPAQWSSLPGIIMPGGPDYYPSLKEIIDYLKNYEHKYQLPIQRPVKVKQVVKENQQFLLETDQGEFRAKAVVSATGSFRQPYTPDIAGKDQFKGKVIRSSAYLRPDPFKSQQVAVVGEGNSGAQILAEVSEVAQTFWITAKEPRFLPDHIDGRYLFDAATQMYEAKKAGKEFKSPSLGDIVMVPTVKQARARGIFNDPYPPIDHFTDLGIMLVNGRELLVDTVIFCTGFRPSLLHLEGLGIDTAADKIPMYGTHAAEIPGLWMVGYGQWTGFASATLIGVGRSAKATAEEIASYVETAAN